MGYATILGLDLGKFKSVCCVMDAVTGRHAFETLASTPAVIDDLLTRHAAAASGEEGSAGHRDLRRRRVGARCRHRRSGRRRHRRAHAGR